jgi:uncharacterized protein YbcI
MEVHTNGNARHIKDSNTCTTTTLIDNDQNIPELQPDEITGWRTINDDAAKLLGLDLNYCTIDRIPASEMTKDKFQKEYFGQKPVVISNMTDHWSAHKKWNHTYFIKRFGTRLVEVDETNVFADYGESNTKKSLKKYLLHDLKNITLSRVLDLAHKSNPRPLKYSFHNFDDGEWDDLIEDSPTPSLFQFIGTTKGHVNQLGIGGTGTGLSWHSHHDAWNSIVVGKKLWLISNPVGPTPAGTGLFSTNDDPHCCSALNWYMEESKRRKKHTRTTTQTNRKNNAKGVLTGINTLHIGKKWQDSVTEYTSNLPGESNWDYGSQDHVAQCVVHAGEAIYVPSRWAHATMNIGDTIARSQRAGLNDMYISLEKYANSVISFDLDHNGRYGVKMIESDVQNKKLEAYHLERSESDEMRDMRRGGKTQEGVQQYIHLNELLNNNALDLICDTTQAYDIRIVVFKYMTKIIKKVDRALKKMVRNMKTTMPSQTNNREKVRKHFQSSDLSIRNFKTQMGTCYISGLYRTNSNSNKISEIMRA